MLNFKNKYILQHIATGDCAAIIIVVMENLYIQTISRSHVMMRFVHLVLSLFALDLFAFATYGQCTLEAGPRLVASDGTSGDVFGLSGAVDGDVMAIGAIWDDDHGFNSGAVYVFVLDAKGDWNETVKIVPADGGAEDVFGRSVAVNGDTIVVGANGDDVKGFDAGAGYVFIREGDTWVQQVKLLANDGAAVDRVGWSVDIDGDTAILSAHRDDDAGSSSGAAYVFVRDDSDHWIQVAKLTASDAAADDVFGHDVAVSGNTIIVGAYKNDDSGSSSGSAYVFERGDHSPWHQTQKLTASDANSGYHFGRFLDVQGDVALIGSPFRHPLNYGAVYVLRRGENGLWNEVALLTADIPTTQEWFGSAVSLDGNTALIGSFYGEGNHPGEAYIFHNNGDDDWAMVANPTAFDGSVGDGFGRMVAINEGNIIIGASSDDAIGIDSGSAYAFSIDCDEDILGDLDGDDVVGTTDLLILLGNWGICADCGNCPADLDDDCTVGTSDLLILLSNWG